MSRKATKKQLYRRFYECYICRKRWHLDGGYFFKRQQPKGCPKCGSTLIHQIRTKKLR